MKKRLILLLTNLIIFMGSFAQQATSTQRLKFMGKSMDCSMSEMATHLQTKGCKMIAENEGFICMKGTFLGYSDCLFVLKEDHNILDACGVLLPNIYNLSWTKLELHYNKTVEKFTQKYGAPLISKSEFEGYPYYDFEKLNFVENDKCNYYSLFCIEGGFIKVAIVDNKSVLILYEDSISKNRIEKIQQDEL